MSRRAGALPPVAVRGGGADRPRERKRRKKRHGRDQEGKQPVRNVRRRPSSSNRAGGAAWRGGDRSGATSFKPAPPDDPDAGSAPPRDACATSASLCVATTIDGPEPVQLEERAASAAWPAESSRLPVGSSASSRLGRPTTARDRHPLLLAAGQLARAEPPACSTARPSGSFPSRRRQYGPQAARRCARGSATCRRRYRCGSSRKSWNTTPIRRRSRGRARRSARAISVPRTAIRPVVGRRWPGTSASSGLTVRPRAPRAAGSPFSAPISGARSGAPFPGFAGGSGSSCRTSGCRRLTAFDNVALPLRIAGRPEGQIRADVTEMTRWVGLSNKLEARPGELRGEQRRVAIARAVVSRPSRCSPTTDRQPRRAAGRAAYAASPRAAPARDHRGRHARRRARRPAPRRGAEIASGSSGGAGLNDVAPLRSPPRQAAPPRTVRRAGVSPDVLDRLLPFWSRPCLLAAPRSRGGQRQLAREPLGRGAGAAATLLVPVFRAGAGGEGTRMERVLALLRGAPGIASARAAFCRPSWGFAAALAWGEHRAALAAATRVWPVPLAAAPLAGPRRPGSKRRLPAP